MQAALIQLTGARRGRIDLFDEDLVCLGADATNDIALQGPDWPMVAPQHAEIRQKDGTFLLADVAFAGLWVNGRKVSNAFLADGDLFQLGAEGPQFRFRLRPQQDGRRSFPAILSDSRAIVRAGGGAPLVSATDFARHLTMGLVREASWFIRIAVLCVLLAVAGFLVLVPFFLVRGYFATQQTSREVSALTARLREERLSREELGGQVERELALSASQRNEFVRLGEERDRLRSALEATDAKLRRLESERILAERIIRRYSAAVAFIQGALGFKDPSGRPLRFLDVDDHGQPLRDALGRPMLSPEGKGPAVTTPFTGSGFLASRDGKILTNRHVAEPWRDDEEMAPLLAVGYKPELKLFRAFFPGVSEAVPLTLLAVDPEADVAVLQGVMGRARLPVLELDRTGREAIAGRSVILLGYPAGIEALLAKADPAAARELLAAEIPDVYRLAEVMAARGLVRPAATQGHLGDVQPHQLTYDAQTAVGGSGGPLIDTSGHVIGINQAVLRHFSGSNFGVPIHYAVELLRRIPLQ
jgi:serine protease Do